MKKILIILVLTILATIAPANATVLSVLKIPGAMNLYYSPTQQTWTMNKPTDDAIKVSKNNNNFYVDNKLAFTLKGDYIFLENNQLVAVNNSQLKYFMPVYDKDKFSVKEMKGPEVQKVFPDATILAISEFKNGVFTAPRELRTENLYLLVNDTPTDYSKHALSPSTVERGMLRGCFGVTRSRDIKFVIDGDVGIREDKLKIKTRLEDEPAPNTDNTRPVIMPKGKKPYTYVKYNNSQDIYKNYKMK